MSSFASTCASTRTDTMGASRLLHSLSLGALVTAALATLSPAHAAEAEAAPAAPNPAPAPEAATRSAADGNIEMTTPIVVSVGKTTRTATELAGTEIQKILPGVSALGAIQTLPGVMYQTADPWGNNEQNMSLFIHGFAINQLGYTLDGLPLGDLSYGSISGISIQRAIISEDIGNVVVATGAGGLGVPSLNNLGGAIETTSAIRPDPCDRPRRRSAAMAPRALMAASTPGPSAPTEFARLCRLLPPAGPRVGLQWPSGWLAGQCQVRPRERRGKLTAYFDYSDKQEPNEDATTTYARPATAAQAYTPYTRPFMFPNWSQALSYVDAQGNTPAAQGSNYLNYFSAALRTDYLGYLKYEANLGSNIHWTNLAYYHHNDGQGVVAGPLGQSLSVARAYFPTTPATSWSMIRAAAAASPASPSTGSAVAARLDASGASRAPCPRTGWLVRAQQRHDLAQLVRARCQQPDRSLSLAAEPAVHPVQPGIPHRFHQLHLQDQWKVNDKLTVEGGIKSSLVFAKGWYPIQPVAGSYSGMVGGLPSGNIDPALVPARDRRQVCVQPPRAGLLQHPEEHAQLRHGALGCRQPDRVRLLPRQRQARDLVDL
jgi:hypothetical protein